MSPCQVRKVRARAAPLTPMSCVRVLTCLQVHPAVGTGTPPPRMAVELEPDPAVACEPEPELEPDPAVAREPEPQCKNGWLCTCKAYSGSRGKPTHNQQCARKENEGKVVIEGDQVQMLDMAAPQWGIWHAAVVQPSKKIWRPVPGEGGHPQHPKGSDNPFIVVETKNSKRKESEGQGKRGGKRAIHSTRAPSDSDGDD